MSAQVFYLKIPSSRHPLSTPALLLGAELCIFLRSMEAVSFPDDSYVRSRLSRTELAGKLSSLLLSSSVRVLQKTQQFKCSPRYLGIVQWLNLRALNLSCGLCDQLQRNIHTLMEKDSMRQRYALFKTKPFP